MLGTVQLYRNQMYDNHLTTTQQFSLSSLDLFRSVSGPRVVAVALSTSNLVDEPEWLDGPGDLMGKLFAKWKMSWN